MKIQIILYCLIGFVLLSDRENGVHVTRFQKVVSWESVKTWASFAILLGGKGKVYDSFFNTFYSGARKVGMKIGSLWCSKATSVSDAVEEAKLCLKILNGKQFEFPIYYEISKEIIARGIQNEILDKFCSILEKNKYYCGVFSDSNFYENNSFTNSTLENRSIWTFDIKNRPSFKCDIWTNDDRNVPGIKDKLYTDVGYTDFDPIIKEKGLNGFGKN